MSRARPSIHELNQIYGTKHKRDEMMKATNSNITTKLKDIITKSKQIPKDQFDAWDKASLQKAIEINAEAEMEALRIEIARLMELAGVHYGVEKNLFWKRYHARQKAKRDG